MQIEFSPQRSDQHVNYSFAGDIITVVLNGTSETYDFTDIPDGGSNAIDQGVLPFPCVLQARKSAGVLTVMLVLTHSRDEDAPEETRFPNNPYTENEAVLLLERRNNAIVVEPPEEPIDVEEEYLNAGPQTEKLA